MKNLFVTVLIAASFHLQAQIIFSSNFATKDPRQGGVFNLQQLANKPWDLQFIDSAGVWEERFEVRKTDTLQSNSKRAETGAKNAIARAARMYRIKQRNPAWQGWDKWPEVLFQLVDENDKTGVELLFVKLYDKFQIWMECYPDSVTHKHMTYDVGVDTILGQKNDWVLEFIPAIDSSGRIRMWRNGVPVTFFNGTDKITNKPLLNKITTVIRGANVDGIKVGGIWKPSPLYFKNGCYCSKFLKGNGDYPFRVNIVELVEFGDSTATISDFYPAAPAATASGVNVSCFGAADGSASVAVIGGVAPISYTWSSGETTPSIINKAPGKYVVTVTAGNGATSKDSVVLTQPTAVSASGTYQVINAITANITVKASGGTAPYFGTGTYVQAPGTTVSYPVTDSKGCPASASVTVPPAALPTQNNYLILNRL